MTLENVRGFLARHDKALRTLCRAGFAISVLTVCVLSLLPEDELPDTTLSDKVGHLIAYGEIVTIGLLAYRGPRAAYTVPLAILALGGALEIAQGFIPSRSADMIDFAVNCAGVLIGIVFARMLTRLWPASRPITSFSERSLPR